MLWLGLKFWNIQGAAGAWSLRILLETCLLLYISNALSRTSRLAAPYLALVAIAMAGAWWLPRALFAHLGLAVGLIGICLLMDRELIFAGAKAFGFRKMGFSP